MAEKSKSKPSPSSSPAPSEAPGASSSGTGPYLIGALILAAAIAALLYTRCEGEPEPQEQAQPAVTAPPPEPIPEFAPPPPPEEEEEEEEDAGAEEGPSEKPRAGGATGGSRGACSQCGKGVPSSALRTAVAQTGGLARGCYNRTLRQGGAEGSMTVSVSIGSNGNVCGARIVSDSVGNPALSQCVLSKFNSRSYPAPDKGCVVVNVPISFSMKK